MKKTYKSKWVWMPHAGHFILGDKCKFRMATYVGKYIVSTVGELKSRGDSGENGWGRIGSDRTYETFVFKAKKSKNDCCPFVMADASEIDSDGYNDQKSAYKGHLRLCEKWNSFK